MDLVSSAAGREIEVDAKVKSQALIQKQEAAFVLRNLATETKKQTDN